MCKQFCCRRWREISYGRLWKRRSLARESKYRRSRGLQTSSDRTWTLQRRQESMTDTMVTSSANVTWSSIWMTSSTIAVEHNYIVWQFEGDVATVDGHCRIWLWRHRVSDLIDDYRRHRSIGGLSMTSCGQRTVDDVMWSEDCRWRHTIRGMSMTACDLSVDEFYKCHVIMGSHRWRLTRCHAIIGVTVTWVPSGFSGYMGLDTNIVLSYLLPFRRCVIGRERSKLETRPPIVLARCIWSSPMQIQCTWSSPIHV